MLCRNSPTTNETKIKDLSPENKEALDLSHLFWFGDGFSSDHTLPLSENVNVKFNVIS